MFDSITIEPSVHGGKPYAVYGHGEYEEWSVLAGQPRRVFLNSFDTVEEALAWVKTSEYGEAEVIEHSTKTDVNLPKTPPEWFDPLDAGESWDEID